MDKLIKKYINKEITSSELAELQQWVVEDPANAQLLAKLEGYSKTTPDELEDMEELVWEELQARIDKTQATPLAVKKSSRRSLYVYGVAASALIVLCAVILLLLMPSGESDQVVTEAIPVITMQKSTNPGQKMTTKLPDGTIVILNASSNIEFPSVFDQEKRVVKLTGEAFFEVTHDTFRPFYVRFGDSEVKVLGTSFNIRTYDRENTVSVAVATGRVSFTNSDAQSEVILEPNQMVSYDEVEKQMIKRKFDPMELYGWKDKILYFKNDEFEDIIKELENWYGVSINAEKDFSQKGTFSGVFKNSSLEHVLVGLSYLYEFKYEIKGNKVTLK